MRTLSFPPEPQRGPPADSGFVLLVVILAFMAVMTALGCDPVTAIGAAGGAAAIAYGPRDNSGPQ